MPFFPSLPEDAGPPTVFARYPDVYRPWAEMSQQLMNGPSPLTSGERELILAYAAGLLGCDFVADAHAEVAYAWGIEDRLVRRLLENAEAVDIPERLAVLLAYVRNLIEDAASLAQKDADAVFAQGWDEQALHDAIAISGRAAFQATLVNGFGFNPVPQAVAAAHARKRVERGYVNLYSKFRSNEQP